MNQFIKYISGVRFFLILTVCVALSLWLSHYIPDDYFDNVLSPLLLVCSSTVSCVGAWIILRHSDGLHVRKAWGYTLLAWGICDGAYILFWLIAPTPVMNMGAYQLNSYELLIGNILGWMLLLYPTEALRPGWLNFKHALWQLLPMFALVALDYLIPLNLAPLITLYPFVLITLLISHVRAYKVWCEENYSTLDDIDVEWIMRYLSMLVLIGGVYLYMCITHGHTRGFTQLWLMIFMFVYSTEQILFRRDPWELLRISEKADAPMPHPQHSATWRQTLEDWMNSEKPYLNPAFRLIDLQNILHVNRTYLSQFIHAEYGCTFYQFVNHYRIEEAQRLLQENPSMKMGDISSRCGFSSPTVFSRTFTSLTGMHPHEWAKKINPA